MTDLYKIGVSLTMTENASAVLGVLGRRVLGLSGQVKELEGGFGRLKLAIAGLAGVTLGATLLTGLEDLAKHGARLQTAQTEMLKAGIQYRDVVRETAIAYKSMSDVRGFSVAERVDAIRELRGIVGAGRGGNDFREINRLLPDYLKTRALLGDKDSNNVFRAIEQQGGARFTASGEFDQARFDRYLSAAMRTLQAAGGNLTGRDLLSVMQMASTTARGMNPDSFWNLMMTPMLEMGGYRAGTGLTAFSRAFFGGIMPERNARELDRLGLYNAGAIRPRGHLTAEERAELRAQGYTIGKGGSVMVGQGALIGNGELNDPSRGIFPWINDFLVPRLRADYQRRFSNKPGNTETWDAYVRNEMYTALPTETARRIVALLVGQPQSVQRDQTLRSSAPGIVAYDTAQQNFNTQLANLKKSLEGLLQTLGLPAAQDGAKILGAIGKGIDGLTQWASRHPNAARDLERLAAGIAVLAGVSGAAAIAGAAFGPLAAGLRLLSASVIGGAATATSIGVIGTALGGLGRIVSVATISFTAGYQAMKAIEDRFPAFRKWVDDHTGFIGDAAKATGLAGSVPDTLSLDEWQKRRSAHPPVAAAPSPLSMPSRARGRAPAADYPAPLDAPSGAGLFQHAAYVMQPVHVYLDGREIARHTERRIVHGMSGVHHGTSSWDPTSTPLPPGLVPA